MKVFSRVWHKSVVYVTLWVISQLPIHGFCLSLYNHFSFPSWPSYCYCGRMVTFPPNFINNGVPQSSVLSPMRKVCPWDSVSWNNVVYSVVKLNLYLKYLKKKLWSSWEDHWESGWKSLETADSKIKQIYLKDAGIEINCILAHLFIIA